MNLFVMQIIMALLVLYYLTVNYFHSAWLAYNWLRNCEVISWRDFLYQFVFYRYSVSFCHKIFLFVIT